MSNMEEIIPYKRRIEKLGVVVVVVVIVLTVNEFLQSKSYCGVPPIGAIFL